MISLVGNFFNIFDGINKLRGCSKNQDGYGHCNNYGRTFGS